MSLLTFFKPAPVYQQLAPVRPFLTQPSHSPFIMDFKILSFRWLLALASKVAQEYDLQGKQVLHLVLSGFGMMINLFLHLY